MLKLDEIRWQYRDTFIGVHQAERSGTTPLPGGIILNATPRIHRNEKDTDRPVLY